MYIFITCKYTLLPIWNYSFGTYSDIQEINGICYTKTRMKYRVNLFVYLIVVLLARTKHGCIHIERFRDMIEFNTIFRV